MNTTTTKSLEQIMKTLPPEAQNEAYDFIHFLKDRYAHKLTSIKTKAIKFSWAGALKDLKDQYTSVELQHKIRDMWL